ncbi:hypothetical protein MPH_09081 [Macrophomina phaseolina MS6]|uniref:Uncharacterized protein n=1 Tax=Macrophomina phaseolina (strain MS6) TaxID=1126212 RepID=K2RLR9_MACPH|nr:hypothetical protein MPH_09081 [Macrophomina phaseolina MS6]
MACPAKYRAGIWNQYIVGRILSRTTEAVRCLLSTVNSPMQGADATCIKPGDCSTATPHKPIPTRIPQIVANLDGAWPRRQGCSPARLTLPTCISCLHPCRKGIQEARVVWLHHPRQHPQHDIWKTALHSARIHQNRHARSRASPPLYQYQRRRSPLQSS